MSKSMNSYSEFTDFDSYYNSQVSYNKMRLLCLKNSGSKSMTSDTYILNNNKSKTSTSL